MNTTLTFREAADPCGQESHRPRIRFPADCLLTTGLRFALFLAASGIVLVSTVAAQDDSWPDPPRRQQRSVARSYADDELPSRKVAMDDDTPPLTPPVRRGTVDSPSNQPSRRRQADAAADTAQQSAVPDEGSQAARRTPSAPRHSVAVDDGETGGPQSFGSCGQDGDECEFGYRGPGLCGILSNRLWFRGDALLWWARGGQAPPLLTTSPGSTPQAQAGVLGEPNTTVLFGDQELNTGLHAGTRLSFGLWLNDCEESGVEFSYLILGTNTQTYSNASTGIPILARPFFNTATGAEDSNLIAFPNAFGGTFNASSTENFQGAEALWRQAIVHGCDGRIDVLAGYRFQRLTDGLEIADSVTTSGTASTSPAGTTINVSDTFHTRNDFNGADLGFATQWHRNRWSLDTTLKLGIGQTFSHVLINGSTTVFQNGAQVGNYPGGFLALQSQNYLGTHDSRQFSMLPEIGFTLGYDLTPRLKATAGYTLLYWSNVARPGDQIDLNLDPALFPPATAAGVKPAFALHTSDFWAQGVNLGLDYRF